MKKLINLFLFVVVVSFLIITCEDEIQNTSNPVVTSVIVTPLLDDLLVEVGKPGTLDFIITVTGQDIFPLDLRSPDVFVGTKINNVIIPVDFISINKDSVQTIKNSGDSSPLTINVDESYAGSIELFISVRGKVSNTFDLFIVSRLTGTVSISGLPYIGNRLSANTANLGGSGTISYQWKRNSDTAIGTNSNIYFLQEADLGHSITVTVSRSRNTGSETSLPTALVVEDMPFYQWVTRVSFSGSTETVTLKNLSEKDIYLAKVNTGSSTVDAFSTGSVLNISPVLTIPPEPSLLVLPDTVLPRIGRPFGEELLYPVPGTYVDKIHESPNFSFTPPAVGDTRNFWIENTFDRRDFVSRQATLMATGAHSNIWVIGNSITTPQAQTLASRFDIIYPAATNILGYEFGGRPGHPTPGGRDGDPKIQILVYPIGGNVGGYFWSKDYYTDSQLPTGWRSNNAEIFYINSTSVSRDIDFAASILIHEFQHMVNFNEKNLARGVSSPAWYNEMLSMMAEDVLAEMVNLPITNSGHVIQQRIPSFLSNYTEEGVTEWGQQLVSYDTKYAFGAYLLRNFNGAEVIKRIMENNSAGINSITAALNEISPGMTFNEALLQYAQAMIFTNPLPPDVRTFDRTVTSTINGFTYNSFAFNVSTMRRRGSTATGPVIYNLNQRTMRPHSISLHSADSWKDITGDYSITLNRPSNSNVEFILLVKK